MRVVVTQPASCATSTLALYRRHRGERPVAGVIYTHSHADHFGGVEGVLPEHRPDSRMARGDVAEEIDSLRHQPGGVVIAHGGATFVQAP